MIEVDFISILKHEIIRNSRCFKGVSLFLSSVIIMRLCHLATSLKETKPRTLETLSTKVNLPSPFVYNLKEIFVKKSETFS